MRVQKGIFKYYNIVTVTTQETIILYVCLVACFYIGGRAAYHVIYLL